MAVRKNVKKKDTSKDTKEGKAPKKRSLALRFFILMAELTALLIIIGVVTAVGTYFYISRDLPKISTLSDYHPPAVTTVYSANNKKIAEFYRERRFVVPVSEIPRTLIYAFVAAEDSRFFEHKGIDLIGIARAFFKNIEAGTIVQGGSTITQQVTKSFLLSPERKYTRKLKEAILAYRIDKAFTKEEILHLYLNQIYFGHGAYGVEAAAENYFAKSVKELDLAECAILAGLPKAPSNFSPYKNFEAAKTRQLYVLNRMVIEGYINQKQADDAYQKPLEIKARRNWFLEKAPFFTEHVRQYLEHTYGKKTLYEGGLNVYTTVDLKMQEIADDALDKGLRELDKRQGYRGPLKKLKVDEIESYSKEIEQKLKDDPLKKDGIVEGIVVKVDDRKKTVTVRMGNETGEIRIADMRWARKPNPKIRHTAAPVRNPGSVLSDGDLILVRLIEKNKKADSWRLALEQTPEVQGALICIEAGSGHVKAMKGGRDFRESQFNRAVQAVRQPGSAFKPIIYAAALDKKDKDYTPATMIIDNAIVKDGLPGKKWKPKNYEHTFYGEILLRQALAKSRNLATISILNDIGIDYAIDYAHKLGITSELSRDLSIALGSSGVSLIELVTAYSVFANLGELIEPVFITKILDQDGKDIHRPLREIKKVIESSTAYLVTSLLESVVKEGTGRRVSVLQRPVAGKTGTTNDLYDAWFIGYTPRYIAGAWVGFDQRRSLGRGETGSRAASPIWLNFMQQILENEPIRAFQEPEGVVYAKIDADTGLLPIPETRKTLFECFKEGTVPTKHSDRPGTVSNPEDFFKSDI